MRASFDSKVQARGCFSASTPLSHGAPGPSVFFGLVTLIFAATAAATWKKKYTDLKGALDDVHITDVHDLAENIPKLKPQSSAFYDHVNYFFKWAKRFGIADVPALVGAGLARLGRETPGNVNFLELVLMSDSFKAARELLLHTRSDPGSTALSRILRVLRKRQIVVESQSGFPPAPCSTRPIHYFSRYYYKDHMTILLTSLVLPTSTSGNL